MNNTNYLGRDSLIINDAELKAIKSFLPPGYVIFRAFIQYQAQTDGRYLQNLYNSYQMARKESLQAFISSGIQQVSD